jgi:hypothetical protein
MRTYTFRLKPGQDLKVGIEQFVSSKKLKTVAIVTCVGGLKRVTMRMAGATPDKQDVRTIDGHFEIVSLMGTNSVDGSHLHISVSDENGTVIGGHLKEGSLVYPTAEIVISESKQEDYSRIMDEETGFPELVVKEK